MRITEIRERIKNRDWQNIFQMIALFLESYKCNYDQAKALIEVGQRNGFIEHDSERDLYRITEPPNTTQHEKAH